MARERSSTAFLLAAGALLVAMLACSTTISVPVASTSLYEFVGTDTDADADGHLGACCKYCSGSSKACGDSCIPVADTCHKSSGCACNGTSPTEPPNVDPAYDHQTKTYTSKFKPLQINNADLTITPFFSPDHSIDTLLDFINGAKSSLDIMTPGFSSWSHCSSATRGCMGCKVSTQSGEKFPVFQALLNAVHRGVSVRILTNDFGDPTCEGEISPLDFLSLNGIQIGFFTSVTFDHSKFLMRDKKEAAISSVNWTRNSIMNNREAGALISGADADLVMEWLIGVYDSDFKQSNPYKVAQTYSKEDMEIITNPAFRNYTVPNAPTRPYMTPTPTPINISGPFTLTTSPDFSYTALMDDLNTVKKSFEIYIYQVTDTRLCDWLKNAHKSGIKVSMLVSKSIYGEDDEKLASICYQELSDAGITIHTAWQFSLYMYNHQKFWIMDNERVTWSTGNWSPSDYPGKDDHTYPPFGKSGWMKTNRDFTVTVADAAVVDVFSKVFVEDTKNSTIWH